MRWLGDAVMLCRCTIVSAPRACVLHNPLVCGVAVLSVEGGESVRFDEKLVYSNETPEYSN